MRKTKSMVYLPSVESRELQLYAENLPKTSDLYNSIHENLYKKYIKGIYDLEKSIAAWYTLVTEANKQYFHDFGFWFSVTERYTAACDIANDFYHDYICVKKG